MLFYLKYLFIYFVFCIKYLSCSKSYDLLEGSGEDYEEFNLGDLLIYDQGLPIPKFPILAKSSSKSGLIPLIKGTTGELTGFTNGLTEEMKKLLNEDKEGIKFSRRKNSQIDSASVHNVIVDSKEKEKKNLMNVKSTEDSKEEDLYNNLPEEKGQFLVEKKPFYLGAMIRNNGMKSLNAFGAYGKSRIMRLFNRNNNRYGSSFGDLKYQLKPGQYFAGQPPPNINSINYVNNNSKQKNQQNVDFRNIITNNLPKNSIASNNVIQKLLTAANSATKTYNRMKIIDLNQNTKNQKAYLSPSLSNIGISNSPDTSIYSRHISTIVQNNTQQFSKMLPSNNKTFVHGISMTQFKKFSKPLEKDENNNNIFVDQSKNYHETSYNIPSYQPSGQNQVNTNINLLPNKQQFLNTVNENTPVIISTDVQKNNNNNVNYNNIYGTQFNNIIHQQKLSNIDKPHHILVEHSPSQKENGKNLFIYSDSQQNNLKIEDFNNELYNWNLNLPSDSKNNAEVVCCDGNVVYSTIPCCNFESKIYNNENNGNNYNFVNNDKDIYYNTLNKINKSSEGHDDIISKTKNVLNFRSYKPISKVQPLFSNMENYSPLPERIGDIYSNNFGNINT
ncbi:Hypothetical protein SRAE_1000351700 [Strongyloides ratti]|uniref:Uncharacterized protein n=1 Tax=Strongyloides ratti TaxID=34506 RepID=A0A090MXD9_STRRB|nr:Hypothetical protein SRAE_1000351700 [Strongyloides ratti]CEF65264.1 Hypothetical protein SRAE_1000351700 [Strongyloides ratti]